jgi:hypothetical protein
MFVVETMSKRRHSCTWIPEDDQTYGAADTGSIGSYISSNIIAFCYMSLVAMCNCPKVHFYEVEFKLLGMRVVPTHKNCGDSLNENQSAKFEKELIQYWGFEEKST